MQQGRAVKVYLADLTLQPAKVAIYVRVMRKWNFNGNDPAGAIRYIGLVLADEKGDSVYAQIPQLQVQRLGSQIENGRAYMISKFSVRASKSGYIPFERRYMIEFNAYTVVDQISGSLTGFPEYIYHLTPFSNINPVGPSATKLIDLLGIVTSVGSARSLQLVKKDRVATIREIFLKDQTDDEVKITLWDDRATEFVLPTPSAPDNGESVVVLIVGCQPATVNGVVQAYGGNACSWYFNPRIKEAQPLYARLNLSPVPVQMPVAEDIGADSVVKPILIEHKTLAELNHIDPYEIPQSGYKCTVTITAIHTVPRWWYVGCQKCGKAAETESVPFVCRCGWKECTPLYKLSFQAKDETAEARFFCYDTVSRKIIRRNIDFMLRESSKTAGLPQQFSNLISRKYTLIVGVTNSSFQDPSMRTFLVKAVSIDYHERAYIASRMLTNQIADPSMASSSIVPVLQHTGLSSVTPTELQLSPQVISVPQVSTPPPTNVNETPPKENTDQSNRVDKLKPKALFPAAASTEMDVVQKGGTKVAEEIDDSMTAPTSLEKDASGSAAEASNVDTSASSLHPTSGQHQRETTKPQPNEVVGNQQGQSADIKQGRGTKRTKPEATHKEA